MEGVVLLNIDLNSPSSPDKQNELALIARQAAEIYELKDSIEVLEEEIARLEYTIDKAKTFLIGIGGPLNDSVAQFSPDQIRELIRLLDILQDVK